MLNVSEPLAAPVAALIDELRRLGWYPSVAHDRLAVHLTHPDGRPVRIASAFIVHKPGAVHRPWRVVAPGLRKARACRTLEEAVVLFMTQMRLHPPGHRAIPNDALSRKSAD